MERARADAVERGLFGESVEAFAQDRLREFRRRPLVTAAQPQARDRKNVVARFWARARVDGGFWHVSGALTRELGRIVIGELAIRPWEGGAVVTTSVLRLLPLSEIRREALAELRGRGRHVDRFEDLEQRTGGRVRLAMSPAERDAVRVAAREAGPLRPALGRGGASPEFLRGVAVAAIRIHGEGSAVYATLAREREAPVPTVRKWVKKARLKGVLSAGGDTWEPGPNFDCASVEAPASRRSRSSRGAEGSR